MLRAVWWFFSTASTAYTDVRSLARLSPRSLVAVLTFLSAGIVTVTLMRIIAS